MIPSKTMIEQVCEMYDPERAAAILKQFDRAAETIGKETYVGELRNESLSPGWYLNVYEYGEPERAYRLGIGEHIIGRSPDCDVVLCNRTASRTHCAITVHADGRIVLRDLHSANHVRVDGVLLEPDGRCEIGEETTILASIFCRMVLRRVA